MALVKVYEWDFYSNLGSRYKIELHQEGGTALVSGLKLGSEGFKLSSKANEDDRFSPIIGTEVEIPILIEDSTAETFINQIAINYEGNSFIKIFAWNGSDWDMFWRGVVQQDLAKNVDEYYPYEFTLSATDGMARLKEIDFKNELIPYTGFESILAILVKALTKLGLNDLFSPTDVFISSGIDIKEINADTGDLLVRTQLKHQAFYDIENGETKYLSTYDVLSQILICFNLRIVQLSGAFHVVSISRYKEDNLTYFYNYSKSGTALTYALKALFIDSTQWERGAGSVYNLYPSLKRVQTTYKYRQSEYPTSFIPQTGPYSLTAYEFLESGSGEKLGIQSGIAITYTSGGASASVFRVKFRVTCYVGSYWLKGSNGQMEWVASTSQYYYFYSEWIYAGYSTSTTAYLDIVTPELIDEGILNFAIDVVGLEDVNSATFTPPAGYSISYFYQAKVFYVGVNNEIAEGVKVVNAYNEIGGVEIGSASIYETEELRIGDAQFVHDVGRIRIYTGADWINSSEWDYGTEYGGVSIEKLRATEILSGQRLPNTQLDCAAYLFKNVTFSDYCNPVAQALYTGSILYVPLSVDFVAGYDEISGTYFEIQRNIADITNDEAIITAPGVFGINQAAKNSEVSNQINAINLHKIATVSTPIAAGAITSISISSMSDAIISKNDVLTLVNSFTGQSENVTVSANVESGAVSISVNAVTLTNSYGIGSYLIYSGARLVRKSTNTRKTEQVLKTDGTVSNYDITNIDASTSSVMVSLPRASDVKQKSYTVNCKDSTQSAGISSVDLIEGNGFLFMKKGESIKLYSDGTTWKIQSAMRYRTSIDFQTDYTYSDAIKQGEVRWNNSDGTLDVGMGYDGVIQQVGLEVYYRIKNQSGSRILDGQVVMYDGALGASGIIKGKISDSTLADFPHAILGVATMDIENGEDGFVTHFGVVRGINTTRFADGDILYWNPSVDGDMTATPPDAPTPRIIVASVIVGGMHNGSILVKPCAGFYMYDLHDVETYDPDTLIQNSVPLWDATDKKFIATELKISDWDEAYQKILSSASFSTTTGVLTLTLADSTTVTVDLDGKYVDSSLLGAANGVATLDSSGRLPVAQLPTSVLVYKGTWNANTNTPTLADGTGTAGWYYIVSTSGTQNLGSGNITFAVGDWVIYSGTIWQKVTNSTAVSSVNGYTGTVVLTTSDIEEGSNLYYTEARVSANTDVAANSAARHTHSNKTTLDGITGTKLSNWDTAYSWGDHAGLYDPIGWAESEIDAHLLAYNHANFVTAYGWGNHADAGYLTSETDPVFLASDAASITGFLIANWTAAYNNSIASASFNVADGLLTLTQVDSGTITVDLDGRYLTSYTETDPIFTASVAAGIDSGDVANWDASYNNSITSASFTGGTLKLIQNDLGEITVSLDGRYYLATNPAGYTTNLGTVTSVGLSVPTGFSVSDQPVTSSGTIAIAFASGYSLPTNAKQSNWDAAYGWGNHATVGYLTSFIESDPIFSASVAADITLIDVTHWGDAYSWGNHAGLYDLTGTASAAISSHLSSYNHAHYDTAYSWGNHALAGYLTSFTESDPIFSASPAYTITTGNKSNWNTAYNKKINSGSFNASTGELTFLRQDATNLVISLDGRYLTSFTETDPIFLTSAAAGISSTNISNWNTAYSWGNHAGLYDLLGAASSAIASHTSLYNHAHYDTAYSWGNHATVGYLTSFTETDPIFLASAAANVTNTKISNWDAAYGWGNHAGLYQAVNVNLTSISALTDPNADRIIFWDDSEGGYKFLQVGSGLTLSGNILSAGIEAKTHTFLCDVSRSESADVQTTNYYTLHIPYDFTITNLIATVSERPTGSAIVIDLLKNGSSILNSPVQIDDGKTSSKTSLAPYNTTSNLLTDDDELIIDVTQVGSATRGKGLKFYICGYQN